MSEDPAETTGVVGMNGPGRPTACCFDWSTISPRGCGLGSCTRAVAPAVRSTPFVVVFTAQFFAQLHRAPLH